MMSYKEKLKHFSSHYLMLYLRSRGNIIILFHFGPDTV